MTSQSTTLPVKIALENSFIELINLLSAVDETQLNTVPFPGSWTAGQVGDHLYKSYDVIGTLKGNTSSTTRSTDMHVQAIRELFLNFEIKMKSPDFIIPSEGYINKEELINGLKERTRAILEFTDSNDLSLSCFDFDFPGYGFLTRLEWLNFIECHTKRHIHQLNTIIARMNV
jgi:hypothetical protein